MKPAKATDIAALRAFFEYILDSPAPEHGGFSRQHVAEARRMLPILESLIQELFAKRKGENT
jgi:hypothetical protein